MDRQTIDWRHLVITVIVVDDEGITYGVNAWRANRTDERDYWEHT